MYNNYYPTRNVLPPQQILQARGKASIDTLCMSPNSSVLIADETAPIVWKCVSDGLGNVTSEPFDISPHKDEKQKTQDTLIASIEQINNRLSHLEELINEQSFISTQPIAAEQYSSNVQNGKKRTKSPSNAKSDDEE